MEWSFEIIFELLAHVFRFVFIAAFCFLLYRQDVTTGPSAVRAVKASSSAPSGSSLATRAAAGRTVKWQSTTGIGASTAASRNAFPWECAVTVSIFQLPSLVFFILCIISIVISIHLTKWKEMLSRTHWVRLSFYLSLFPFLWAWKTLSPLQRFNPRGSRQETSRNLIHLRPSSWHRPTCSYVAAISPQRPAPLSQPPDRTPLPQVSSLYLKIILFPRETLT